MDTPSSWHASAKSKLSVAISLFPCLQKSGSQRGARDKDNFLRKFTFTAASLDAARKARDFAKISPQKAIFLPDLSKVRVPKRHIMWT